MGMTIELPVFDLSRLFHEVYANDVWTLDNLTAAYRRPTSVAQPLPRLYEVFVKDPSLIFVTTTPLAVVNTTRIDAAQCYWSIIYSTYCYLLCSLNYFLLLYTLLASRKCTVCLDCKYTHVRYNTTCLQLYFVFLWEVDPVFQYYLWNITLTKPDRIGSRSHVEGKPIVFASNSLRNLLFGLPRFLFPGNSILSILLPIYPSSFLRRYPYHLSLASCFLSKPSHLCCPSDVLIPDLDHSCHS